MRNIELKDKIKAVFPGYNEAKAATSTLLSVRASVDIDEKEIVKYPVRYRLGGPRAVSDGTLVTP